MNNYNNISSDDEIQLLLNILNEDCEISRRILELHYNELSKQKSERE
jgi:hypothetical protein